MQRLARRVRGWHVAVGLLLYVVGSLLWFQLGPVAELPGILDDDWGFTPEAARAFLEDLGAEGRAEYRTFLVLDFAYPLLFIPGTAAALLLWSRTVRWWPAWTAFAPVLGAVLDWVENALLLRAIDGHPASDGVLRAASAASVAKLYIVSATFAVVALAIIYWTVTAIMHPMRKVKRQ